MYFPTTKSSSTRRTINTAVLQGHRSPAKTSNSGFFTAFVGLLATVNAGAIQPAASPITTSTLDGSLTTVANIYSTSPTPNALTGAKLAILEDSLVRPATKAVHSGFFKRADQSSGVSFGEALNQHQEIRDDLAANGLKYEGGEIVPDGDKNAKDDRKRKMWLGIGLGLGLGLPASFLVGLSIYTWGPGLFNHMRGSPAEAAKLFNMENANIEILEKTLDNLAREVLPNPPPPIDAPAQGSSPLQPGQVANLPAESSVQLTPGSAASLGLEAGGSATLPSGAAVQAGADIEVVALGAGKIVSNIGQAATHLDVTVPGWASGVMQIGPTAATLASETGGEVSSQLVDGKTVVNIKPASVEDMQGRLSDLKKVPESWDAAKDAVRADQDQRASRADKGKKPERPDGRPKDAGDVQQLRKVRDQRRVESESAENDRQKLEREIKQYDETIKREKKKSEELENELEKKQAEIRNRERENERSGKKWTDMQNSIDKLKKDAKEFGERMKKAKDTFKEWEKKDADFKKQEKDFDKETVDLKKQTEESKAKAEESKKKAQEEEKKGKAAESEKTKWEQRVKIVIEDNRELSGRVTKIKIEVDEVEKILDKTKDRLKLAKKALFAARERVNQLCLDWFTPNRCGERPICQAHPKGGEICWHPSHDQKAKQCWLPMDMRAVMQDFGFCANPTPPVPPKAGVCKGQEGIPSLEEVQNHHNGCPLQMLCPSMLPPLDFTKCMLRYACGRSGGPLLKPGHGGPHGSTHGGEFKTTGNQSLSDLDGNLEDDADASKEDAATDETIGQVADQDQIEGGDLVEAVDETNANKDKTNEDEEEHKADAVPEMGPTTGEEADETGVDTLGNLKSKARTAQKTWSMLL